MFLSRVRQALSLAVNREELVSAVLNGNGRTGFVALQGILSTFLVRIPVSYYMSTRPNASLMGVGLAAPAATVFGILLCLGYYFVLKQEITNNGKAGKRV